MLEAFTPHRPGMPEEMTMLLERYPRDSWDAHPGFKEKTRQWLGAHQMFRALAEKLRLDAETYLDRQLDGADYGERLSRVGGALIGNLQGHHAWEDRSYFPELSAADARFDAGLDILEKDHVELDGVLERFFRAGNRAVKLIQLDETQARDDVGAVHGLAEVIDGFLDRHLTDEENLAVPIILHHRLRG